MDTESLSFEQREGLAPLPKQLALGELDQGVKTALWRIVNTFIDKNTARSDYGRPPANAFLSQIAELYYVKVQHGYADDFDNRAFVIKESWKTKFSPTATYADTLGFVEWLVRADRDRTNLAASVEQMLENSLCAYRLVNRNTIMPVASLEEADSFKSAVAALEAQNQPGARRHLLEAASHLSQGRFADSVRESIHCIEGHVRNITGESKFSKAVDKIARDGNLHGSLKQALLNLYGYSSDEQGIRHPLLDQGDANVSERDALFMLGVCASFTTYLLTSKTP